MSLPVKTYVKKQGHGDELAIKKAGRPKGGNEGGRKEARKRGGERRREGEDETAHWRIQP